MCVVINHIINDDEWLSKETLGFTSLAAVEWWYRVWYEFTFIISLFLEERSKKVIYSHYIRETLYEDNNDVCIYVCVHALVLLFSARSVWLSHYICKMFCHVVLCMRNVISESLRFVKTSSYLFHIWRIHSSSSAILVKCATKCLKSNVLIVVKVKWSYLMPKDASK